VPGTATHSLIDPDALTRRFEDIYRESMHDLPIVNAALDVEAIGFRDFGGHSLGVLVTPWFMNLILLPADATWANIAGGDTVPIELPSGKLEMTVTHDERLGVYLSAVLFRSTSDISEQALARDIALEIMRDLFVEAPRGRPLSRRELFTGRQSS
jgi:[NiFe] hydrogenase assembly HybE family chaperone